MKRILANLILSLSLTTPQFLCAQDAVAPTAQQRVAMLKQWLQASQAQLKSYSWVETTVISLKGEVKSRKQNQVYFGVDGTEQKIPIGSAEASKSSGPPGLLPVGRMAKRSAKHHAEEMQAYMENAANLVHSYLPPDPNRIQQAVNSGKFAVNMVKPNQQVRLDFHDYLKVGDTLSVDIEVPTNRLMGMHIASYLDGRDDPVNLDVMMGLLPDGTIYTAETVLNAPAKEVTVKVDNTGHRHTGG